MSTPEQRRISFENYLDNLSRGGLLKLFSILTNIVGEYDKMVAEGVPEEEISSKIGITKETALQLLEALDRRLG